MPNDGTPAFLMQRHVDQYMSLLSDIRGTTLNSVTSDLVVYDSHRIQFWTFRSHSWSYHLSSTCDFRQHLQVPESSSIELQRVMFNPDHSTYIVVYTTEGKLWLTTVDVVIVPSEEDDLSPQDAEEDADDPHHHLGNCIQLRPNPSCRALQFHVPDQSLFLSETKTSGIWCFSLRTLSSSSVVPSSSLSLRYHIRSTTHETFQSLLVHPATPFVFAATGSVVHVFSTIDGSWISRLHFDFPQVIRDMTFGKSRNDRVHPEILVIGCEAHDELLMFQLEGLLGNDPPALAPASSNIIHQRKHKTTLHRNDHQPPNPPSSYSSSSSHLELWNQPMLPTQVLAFTQSWHSFRFLSNNSPDLLVMYSNGEIQLYRPEPTTFRNEEELTTTIQTTIKFQPLAKPLLPPWVSETRFRTNIFLAMASISSSGIAVEKKRTDDASSSSSWTNSAPHVLCLIQAEQIIVYQVFTSSFLQFGDPISNCFQLVPDKRKMMIQSEDSSKKKNILGFVDSKAYLMSFTINADFESQVCATYPFLSTDLEFSTTRAYRTPPTVSCFTFSQRLDLVIVCTNSDSNSVAQTTIELFHLSSGKKRRSFHPTMSSSASSAVPPRITCCIVIETLELLVLGDSQGQVYFYELQLDSSSYSSSSTCPVCIHQQQGHVATSVLNLWWSLKFDFFLSMGKNGETNVWKLEVTTTGPREVACILQGSFMPLHNDQVGHYHMVEQGQHMILGFESGRLELWSIPFVFSFPHDARALTKRRLIIRRRPMLMLATAHASKIQSIDVLEHLPTHESHLIVSSSQDQKLVLSIWRKADQKWFPFREFTFTSGLSCGVFMRQKHVVVTRKGLEWPVVHFGVVIHSALYIVDQVPMDFQQQYDHMSEELLQQKNPNLRSRYFALNSTTREHDTEKQAKDTSSSMISVHPTAIVDSHPSLAIHMNRPSSSSSTKQVQQVYLRLPSIGHHQSKSEDNPDVISFRPKSSSRSAQGKTKLHNTMRMVASHSTNPGHPNEAQDIMNNQLPLSSEPRTCDTSESSQVVVQVPSTDSYAAKAAQMYDEYHHAYLGPALPLTSSHACVQSTMPLVSNIKESIKQPERQQRLRRQHLQQSQKNLPTRKIVQLQILNQEDETPDLSHECHRAPSPRIEYSDAYDLAPCQRKNRHARHAFHIDRCGGTGVYPMLQLQSRPESPPQKRTTASHQLNSNVVPIPKVGLVQPSADVWLLQHATSGHSSSSRDHHLFDDGSGGSFDADQVKAFRLQWQDFFTEQSQLEFQCSFYSKTISAASKIANISIPTTAQQTQKSSNIWIKYEKWWQSNASRLVAQFRKSELPFAWTDSKTRKDAEKDLGTLESSLLPPAAFEHWYARGFVTETFPMSRSIVSDLQRMGSRQQFLKDRLESIRVAYQVNARMGKMELTKQRATLNMVLKCTQKLGKKATNALPVMIKPNPALVRRPPLELDIFTPIVFPEGLVMDIIAWKDMSMEIQVLEYQVACENPRVIESQLTCTSTSHVEWWQQPGNLVRQSWLNLECQLAGETSAVVRREALAFGLTQLPGEIISSQEQQTTTAEDHEHIIAEYQYWYFHAPDIRHSFLTSVWTSIQAKRRQRLFLHQALRHPGLVFHSGSGSYTSMMMLVPEDTSISRTFYFPTWIPTEHVALEETLLWYTDIELTQDDVAMRRSVEIELARLARVKATRAQELERLAQERRLMEIEDQIARVQMELESSEDEGECQSDAGSDVEGHYHSNETSGEVEHVTTSVDHHHHRDSRFFTPRSTKFISGFSLDRYFRQTTDPSSSSKFKFGNGLENGDEQFEEREREELGRLKQLELDRLEAERVAEVERLEALAEQRARDAADRERARLERRLEAEKILAWQITAREAQVLEAQARAEATRRQAQAQAQAQAQTQAQAQAEARQSMAGEEAWTRKWDAQERATREANMQRQVFEQKCMGQAEAESRKVQNEWTRVERQRRERRRELTEVYTPFEPRKIILETTTTTRFDRETKSLLSDVRRMMAITAPAPTVDVQEDDAKKTKCSTELALGHSESLVLEPPPSNEIYSTTLSTKYQRLLGFPLSLTRHQRPQSHQDQVRANMRLLASPANHHHFGFPKSRARARPKKYEKITSKEEKQIPSSKTTGGRKERASSSNQSRSDDHQQQQDMNNLPFYRKDVSLPILGQKKHISEQER